MQMFVYSVVSPPCLCSRIFAKSMVEASGNNKRGLRMRAQSTEAIHPKWTLNLFSGYTSRKEEQTEKREIVVVESSNTVPIKNFEHINSKRYQAPARRLFLSQTFLSYRFNSKGQSTNMFKISRTLNFVSILLCTLFGR